MMSSESGKPLGSCLTRAARYWLTTPSRHARSQLSGMGPVEAPRLVARSQASAAATRARAARVERIEVLLRLGKSLTFLACHLHPADDFGPTVLRALEH